MQLHSLVPQICGTIPPLFQGLSLHQFRTHNNTPDCTAPIHYHYLQIYDTTRLLFQGLFSTPSPPFIAAPPSCSAPLHCLVLQLSDSTSPPLLCFVSHHIHFYRILQGYVELLHFLALQICGSIQMPVSSLFLTPFPQ